MQSLRNVVAAALLAAPALTSHAEQRCQGAPARAEGDFAMLAGGAQVHDRKTGLIWMRCIEGQTWTGSVCRADDPAAVNPGPRVMYEQAQRLAATRSSTEEKWRIPTQKELLSLREPKCYNPSMSLRLFPTEPQWSSDGSFWTSTPQGRGVALVSAIGTSDSWSTIEALKTNHVRLVRSAPEERK